MIELNGSAINLHACCERTLKLLQLGRHQRLKDPVTEVGFKLINDVFVIVLTILYAGRPVSIPRTETQHTKIPRKHIVAKLQCGGRHSHLSAIT
jgi:hypothetical protein